jgi:hypothetical protein
MAAVLYGATMVGWFELCFEFRFFIGRGDRRCVVSKLGIDVAINDVEPFAASSCR